MWDERFQQRVRVEQKRVFSSECLQRGARFVCDGDGFQVPWNQMFKVKHCFCIALLFLSSQFLSFITYHLRRSAHPFLSPSNFQDSLSFSPSRLHISSLVPNNSIVDVAGVKHKKSNNSNTLNVDPILEDLLTSINTFWQKTTLHSDFYHIESLCKTFLESVVDFPAEVS